MTDQMRKEFEAWAGPYGHDISRSEINPEDYRCQETEWAYDAWQAARRVEPERVEPPAGIIDRINAAIQRVVDGHAPRRIPADPTDVDLVLAECLGYFEGRWPPFWLTAPQQEQK